MEGLNFFLNKRQILALTRTYVTLKILIFVLRLPSTLSKLILLVVSIEIIKCQICTASFIGINFEKKRFEARTLCTEIFDF